MMILEIASQLTELMQTTGGKQYSHLPSLRFCWWGAEEEGLLGSQYYVSHLNNTSPTALHQIVLNLNFDMVASPNYVRGVYDAQQIESELLDGLSPTKFEYLKNASSMIGGMFIEHFKREKLPYVNSEFNGRSDYGPFLQFGIPAGGLDSGAEGIKTDKERHMFGGMAKTAYDPCYHQACDTVDNVDRPALQELSKAAATIVSRLSAQVSLRQILAHQRNFAPYGGDINIGERRHLDQGHFSASSRTLKEMKLGLECK